VLGLGTCWRPSAWVDGPASVLASPALPAGMARRRRPLGLVPPAAVDTDQLTGFLARAFARYVGGARRRLAGPAPAVAVDLDLRPVNGQNGFGKGDAPLTDLGHQLEDPAWSAAWWVASADCFAWIGIGHAPSRSPPGSWSRASPVTTGRAQGPRDRDPPRSRHRRQRDGRRRASRRQGRAPFVAFDRGRLTVDYMALHGAAAEARLKIRRPQRPRDHPDRVPADRLLDDGRTVGFGRSRFRAEPQRPPTSGSPGARRRAGSIG
jgi:hypothetical protein